MVLLQQQRAKGGGKLADGWESVPCAIVKQPNPDLPVFVVKPEHGEEAEKVLHKNLMDCCPVNYGPNAEIPQKSKVDGPEDRQAGLIRCFVCFPGAVHHRAPA